ncbi:unnamed protein product [Trichobilharzia szidati]|nr:unnamed protein product [Trichobilharzia szidati]
MMYKKPDWYKYFTPVASVTRTHCVLEWPESNFASEFPVFCPTHGCLSQCHRKTNEGGDDDDDKVNLTKSNINGNGDAKLENDSDNKIIENILRNIWKNELSNYLKNFYSTGNASDVLKRRQECFTGKPATSSPLCILT